MATAAPGSAALPTPLATPRPDSPPLALTEWPSSDAAVRVGGGYGSPGVFDTPVPLPGVALSQPVRALFSDEASRSQRFLAMLQELETETGALTLTE